MLTAFDEGVNEIWLTSEDTGAYGRDINTNIIELLILLVENMPEDKMLRIGMTNPPYILEHLEGICEILNHPQVFKFLHVPIQAGNNNTLERMNREYTVEEFSTVADGLITKVPKMTVSTDVICGFPGETEEEFLGTMAVIERFKFPVLNISKFYPRPGTVAARMKPIDSKVKKDRSKRVTSLFEGYKDMHHLKDQVERVWINEWETKKGGGKQLVGHTSNYSKVILPMDEELLGKQVMMKITKTFKWHVEGEIVDMEPQPIAVPDGALNKVKALYAEKKAKRDAILAKRKKDRTERLKELRRKAEEEAKAKLRAMEAEEGMEEIPQRDTNIEVENNVQVGQKDQNQPDIALGVLGLVFLLAGVVLYFQGY